MNEWLRVRDLLDTKKERSFSQSTAWAIWRALAVWGLFIALMVAGIILAEMTRYEWLAWVLVVLAASLGASELRSIAVALIRHRRKYR